jgi:glucose-1-phosphatase
MNFDPASIDAIIFDLGEVLVHLSPDRMVQHFARLSEKSKNELRGIHGKHEFFFDYELGRISDEDFRNHLKDQLNLEVDDETLDEAWYQMLDETPEWKWKLVESLKSKYRTFVLSNTNRIHMQKIDQMVKDLGIDKCFDDFFEKAYLSYEIGLAKPDPEAWKLILDTDGLKPSSTLFIDDKKENIIAASKLGFQTFHNKGKDEWTRLF